jgi:hypothetical protein
MQCARKVPAWQLLICGQFGVSGIVVGFLVSNWCIFLLEEDLVGT